VTVRDRRRVIWLTLYYVAVMGGVLVAHLVPDYRATPFVYQAF
jgi:hypothetical protein